MADPTVQSFCCRRPSTPQQHMLMATESLIHEFSSKPYLITTLCSATIGMVGALYQILIRYLLNRDGDLRMYYLQTMNFRVPKRLLAQNVGKKIIVWLAVADLLASGAVFIRATFWIYVRPNVPVSNWNAVMPEGSRIIFCAVISGLIQYFYTCTWLWTLCYAFNIRVYLKDALVEERRYHSFVWPTAALLTSVGTVVLYYPNADCHSFSDTLTALTRVLPNYCVTYLPIILVMLVNPILYHNAAQNIEMDVASGGTQFSPAERSINSTLKWKFLMINVVFYICWLPNLVCGVTLWTSWHNLPEKFLLSVWYIMAMLNPLQAFFNTLVYRKWQPLSSNAYLQTAAIQRAFRDQRTLSMGERAPLLSGPRTEHKPSAPQFHQL